MKKSKRKAPHENAYSTLEIGFKSYIIPKFLDDIEESTIDLQLILYLAATFNRMDIVAAFANGLYSECDFHKEKKKVCFLAAAYGHKELMEFCESY